jgi:hypothetical protein
MKLLNENGHQTKAGEHIQLRNFRHSIDLRISLCLAYILTIFKHIKNVPNFRNKTISVPVLPFTILTSLSLTFTVNVISAKFEKKQHSKRPYSLVPEDS